MKAALLRNQNCKLQNKVSQTNDIKEFVFYLIPQEYPLNSQEHCNRFDILEYKQSLIHSFIHVKQKQQVRGLDHDELLTTNQVIFQCVWQIDRNQSKSMLEKENTSILQLIFCQKVQVGHLDQFPQKQQNQSK
ncbi:hypothetical protein ABPG74_020294 [Tetrahymena malaccensis]